MFHGYARRFPGHDAGRARGLALAVGAGKGLKDPVVVRIIKTSEFDSRDVGRCQKVLKGVWKAWRTEIVRICVYLYAYILIYHLCMLQLCKQSIKEFKHMQFNLYMPQSSKLSRRVTPNSGSIS